MGLQGDQIALYLSGQDVPVFECNIAIHQPTIKQIIAFKETSFISAIQLFGKADESIIKIRELNPLTEQFTDFQLLMAIIINILQKFNSKNEGKNDENFNEKKIQEYVLSPILNLLNGFYANYFLNSEDMSVLKLKFIFFKNKNNIL